jgi:hypothetical protein
MVMFSPGGKVGWGRGGGGNHTIRETFSEITS